ncbi:MAG: ABC transporter permease subunit, partial [Candidatus Caldatribacteriaceae bacterium]
MYLLSAAFWSVIRIFIAYFVSLLFGIIYGVLAAMNPRRERWMIPLLDVLQSVPILGFFPIAVSILVFLFRGQRIGLELAAIFLIFTSQVWNIAFGVYETVKTFPRDISEMARSFGIDSTFLVKRIYVPSLIPTIIYNSGVSLAVGWYFLMASEIITLGNVEIRLPGLGTAMMGYVAQGNLTGMLATVGTIAFINWCTQWFLFRPLIEWSDLFKFGAVGSAPEEPGLVTFLRNNIRWENFSHHLDRILSWGEALRKHQKFLSSLRHVFYIALLGLSAYFLYWLLKPPYSPRLVEIPGSLITTTFRVIIAVGLSIVLSFPFVIRAIRYSNTVKNIYTLAATMGSVPAVIFYPLIVRSIGREYMGIAAVLLLLTGSLWYTLFNMLKGALMIPSTIVEMASNFGIRGFLYYRTILIPAMLPSLITGTITAWGGAWNASMVAEEVNFGKEVFSIHGIGSLLLSATAHPKELLWVVLAMILWIVFINTFFWKRWYN